MLKEVFKDHKYLFCAGLSTFSLLFTSITMISISKSVDEVSSSLSSISTWADRQMNALQKHLGSMERIHRVYHQKFGVVMEEGINRLSR